MKKILLAPIACLLALVPGASTGFPHGGAVGRPVAERPLPVYNHTPSYVAPRNEYVAPHYEYVGRPAEDYWPAFAPQARPVTPVEPQILNLGGNRPNVGINNKTNLSDRPNIGINNRPTINNTVNRANVTGSRVNVNRSTNINQVNLNVNWNRPNGIYRPGYSYYHNYYGSWHHGYWNSWNYRPWLWSGVGFSTGLVLGATAPNVVYVDPYYDAPPDDVAPIYDYSQPIPVPAPVQIVDSPLDDSSPMPPQGPQPPALPTDAKSIAATKFLDEARAAFMKKDYDAAQQAIDKAVGQLPNDATLHEFRAVVLFARKDYRAAAAAIYAVLAVGPGWDWTTLKSLYPDVDTYTQQLRALEQYCRDNPMAASARFLLAYHYLVLDQRDAAAKMFKSVVALQPDNQLAA